MKEFIKKHCVKILVAVIIIAILYWYFVVYKSKQAGSQSSSYTRYNDKNFPGLVSKSDMPRDTGNDIVDIQLQRMAEANPHLARTIES